MNLSFSPCGLQNIVALIKLYAIDIGCNRCNVPTKQRNSWLVRSIRGSFILACYKSISIRELN